jgi:hypothetical protein
MNKSKKRNKNKQTRKKCDEFYSSKNVIKKIMNKAKSFNKKLNKTIKNKKTLKKCENFCKNDYMVEMEKLSKHISKKYNFPYKPQTKEEDELTYNTCKQTFCNEKCKGYDFSCVDKQTEIDFKKKINNGFQNTYSTNKVNMFKKRGALSACNDIVDYNVFHK